MIEGNKKRRKGEWGSKGLRDAREEKSMNRRKNWIVRRLWSIKWWICFAWFVDGAEKTGHLKRIVGIATFLAWLWCDNCNKVKSARWRRETYSSSWLELGPLERSVPGIYINRAPKVPCPKSLNWLSQALALSFRLTCGHSISCEDANCRWGANVHNEVDSRWNACIMHFCQDAFFGESTLHLLLHPLTLSDLLIKRR